MLETLAYSTGAANPTNPLSGKICLKGHHGKFVGATSDQKATCNSPNGGSEETVEIVVIKTDVVALKSKFGKFLSGWSGSMEYSDLGATHEVMTS